MFILLYLHKQRFNKQVLYLTLILLLANTNTTGFFAALPLGMIYLQEQLLTKSLREQKNILITVIFMAIEFIALYIQFLGYDDKALKSTPDSGLLSISINSSYYPANIVLLCIIYIITCERGFNLEYIGKIDREIIKKEVAVVRKFLELSLRDGRLGFEAANHYLFCPRNLAEKWISLEDYIQKEQM